jgi:biotin carboxyl carrier protein
MAPWPNSALRNKIPLAEQTTSGNLRPQQKAVHEDSLSVRRSRESGMPEIKIVTEVAGRVCALPVATGGNVEIAFVEAMKMEIPVTSTTAGTIKAILVKLDDVIAEGQVVAIIEA